MVHPSTTAFELKVWDWVQTAQVKRSEKISVIKRSLSCMDTYREIRHVRMREGLAAQMEKYVKDMEEAIEIYGDGIDVIERASKDESPVLQINGNQFGNSMTMGGERGDFENTTGGALLLSRHTSNLSNVSDMPEGTVKLRNTRRKTVSAEVLEDVDMDTFRPAVHEKDDETIAWISNALEKNYLFEHLDDEDLTILARAMKMVKVHDDDTVFTQGEDVHTFYIVYSGAANSELDEEVLENFSPGECVGEESLMYASQAQFTLRAVGDLTMWSVDRNTYKHIVTKASRAKRARFENFLSKIDFLKEITDAERLQIADALKTATYEDGDMVIQSGQEGTHFHIILQGTVKVVAHEMNEEEGEMEEVYVCSFSAGDSVGELEFINGHKTCADVVALGTVKTARMGRRHFEKLMGPVEEYLRSRYKGNAKFAYYRAKNPDHK